MFERKSFQNNFYVPEQDPKGFHNKFYRGLSKEFKSRQDLEQS